MSCNDERTHRELESPGGLRGTLHITLEQSWMKPYIWQMKKLRSEKAMKWTVDGLLINSASVELILATTGLFSTEQLCCFSYAEDETGIPLKIFTQINTYNLALIWIGLVVSLVLTVIAYWSCWALGRGVTAQIVQLLQHTKTCTLKCTVNMYCIGIYGKYTSIQITKTTRVIINYIYITLNVWVDTTHHNKNHNAHLKPHHNVILLKEWQNKCKKNHHRHPSHSLTLETELQFFMLCICC